MPKKGKKGDEESKSDSKTVLLGRPKNNVEMGIVGLPNVGKSSFFNLLCGMSVPAENRPFCTIDPTTANVPVPDSRFDHLVDVCNPKSVVPAVLTCTDIAGLVKGAAEGQGLGNAFLSHIDAVDGIFHMVRAFPDKEVSHVEGDVDPVRDMEIIHAELRSKDLARVRTERALLAKKFRAPDAKRAMAEHEFLGKVEENLEAGIDVRCGDWSAGEIEILNRTQFLTAKPMIYLVNLSKKHYLKKKNKWLPGIAEYIKEKSGDKLIPFSVEYEDEIFQARVAGGDEAATKVIKDNGGKSMINKIIKAGYSGLSLVHFFTSGPDEVRAWTIRKGTLAPRAAGTIHTDMENGFQSAEVYSYADFKALGASEAKVKAAGKVRMEGKRYQVQDGDICFFKFNAPKGGKKKKKEG